MLARACLLFLSAGFLSGSTEIEKPVPRFRIATVLNAPFLVQTGPTSYDGFFMDLLKELRRRIPFRYEIYLTPDGTFGSRKRGGKWTGIVGELQKDHAEVGMAPLTVTVSRQEVVDFGLPFFSNNIMLLYRRSNRSESIESLKDLAKTNRKFGPFKSSPTYQLLTKSSTSLLMRSIARKLRRQHASLPRNVSEAEEMVRNDGFVFIGEEKLITFLAGRPPCNLSTAKTGFFRDYALAFPKNSTFRKPFDLAIADIHEKGAMHFLTQKWWPNECAKTYDYCVCQ